MRHGRWRKIAPPSNVSTMCAVRSMRGPIFGLTPTAPVRTTLYARFCICPSFRTSHLLSQLKQDALAILGAALSASDAGNAVRAHLTVPAAKFDDTVLLAVGKAACSMAAAVQEAFGDRLDKSLVVTKQGHVTPLG